MTLGRSRLLSRFIFMVREIKYGPTCLPGHEAEYYASCRRFVPSGFLWVKRHICPGEKEWVDIFFRISFSLPQGDPSG